MANEPQYEELQQQIAKLTERVYKLEQLAGLRPHETPIPMPTVPTDSRERDLESQIGGHWLNRVGIIAVLIGVSYFLRYAFENEWVGPRGRVLIGLVSGTGIVFWSERIRHSGYSIFSYSLKAIGIGILYLSLWAAFQLYHLIPTGLAFFAMICVTAATVALALWQNAEVIAAFATVGAFITPVALSTGENNAVALFSYVAIVDAGALFIFWTRAWVRIVIGSFAGTLILYSGWHASFYTPGQLTTAMFAVSTMFLLFVLVPFVDKRGRDSSDSITVILLILANAGTYFFEVWELFNHSAAVRESAIAAVLLACLYFLAAKLVAGRSPSSTAQVHSAVGSAFLVAAVPIAFDAQWITIGWLVEAAALIEVCRRTGNKALNLIGGVALALGLCRVMIIDKYDAHTILFNERMLVSAVAVAVLAYVARTWSDLDGEFEQMSVPVVIVALNVVALLALNREITDALRGIVRDFAYSALWMAYGAGLMFVGFWKSSRFLRWQALVLIFVTIVKVFLYDTASLDVGYRILSFITLGLVLLVTSFLYQRDWFKVRGGKIQV